MLRNIVNNTRTLKKRFFSATNASQRSFSSVANKHGLFGSLVINNASQSVTPSKHQSRHVVVENSFKGNFVVLRSYAKKAAAPKKTSAKANEAEAAPEPEVAETQGPIGFAQVAKKMIPHPGKRNGGEDACFISKDNSVLAVFDGVGGSAEYGGNPREYALALAKGGKTMSDTFRTRDPRIIMEAGYIEAKKINGSSTACVAVMKDGKVQMANLGDSGMFIIRPPKATVFRSKEQQMEGRWNTPLQLPDHTVDLAHCEEIQVAKGDVVILATDGVFDNIYKEDMIALVEKTVKKHKDANDLADQLATAIANEASSNAHDKKKKSPFEEAAVKFFGSRQHTGGKLDDITVVVGVVGNIEVNANQPGEDSGEDPEPAQQRDLGL